MTAPPDPRKYIRFKKDGRTYVKCTETQEDDEGNVLECTYTVREDKHKSRKIPHKCSFRKKEHTNTISQYFFKEQVTTAELNSSTIYSKMALLAGQMNLSLSFLTSPQFFEFVHYCMVVGSDVLDPNKGNLFEQAIEFLPQKQRKFFRNEMITTARSVHQLTMAEFKKLEFVAIAVDEGKDSIKKNVDFVLENPQCKMEPYPYLTLPIEDETAEGYAPILEHGLSNPSLYGITIGSIVADGNLAQKNVFPQHGKTHLGKLLSMIS